jgi:hypothetical protein
LVVEVLVDLKQVEVLEQEDIEPLVMDPLLYKDL